MFGFFIARYKEAGYKEKLKNDHLGAPTIDEIHNRKAHFPRGTKIWKEKLKKKKTPRTVGITAKDSIGIGFTIIRRFSVIAFEKPAAVAQVGSTVYSTTSVQCPAV